MKFLTLTSFLRMGVLTMVLILSAGSVHAQSNANTRSSAVTDRDNNSTITTVRERDDDINWGWIGLLGLLGLAGLIPKKRTIEHDRLDTNDRTTTR